MNPDKQHLIESLLGPEDPTGQRTATLRAGARVLRVRRWRRRAGLGVSGAAFVAVLVWCLQPFHPSPTMTTAVAPAPAPARPEVHELTDAELLALFPDTPVGLITVGDRKQLIFLRPGDEERFITRL